MMIANETRQPYAQSTHSEIYIIVVYMWAAAAASVYMRMVVANRWWISSILIFIYRCKYILNACDIKTCRKPPCSRGMGRHRDSLFFIFHFEAILCLSAQAISYNISCTCVWCASVYGWCMCVWRWCMWNVYTKPAKITAWRWRYRRQNTNMGTTK